MGCILKGGGGLYSRLVVGAVLLAAGAGSRIGHKPKSLLQLGGVPLIRRQLIALSGAGVDEVVVVLGHHAALIEPVVQDFPVTIVRNLNPDEGQVSSQRLGLAALTGKLDAVIVALADQPLINAQDIGALIGAYKKRPEGAGLDAAGVALRGAQHTEHPHQQRVQRLGVGVAVHAQRRGPEQLQAGLQAHAAVSSAGQRSVWPVSRAKRSRSSGVSMSTR